MAKLKLEEELQQQLQTKNKTTQTCSNSGSPPSDPRGVFIGTRGNGATWVTCGPKRRRARPKGPRKRGRGRVSVALPGRRAPGFGQRVVQSVF